MQISEKQINYITYLFRDTELYEEFPKHNEKYTDKNCDYRDMILHDKIKNYDSWQASELIKDLLKGDEHRVKIDLINNI